MRGPRRRQLIAALVITAALAVATLATAFLEDRLGVPNASAIYLVAVVVSAIAAGTWGGVVAGIAAFLLYDSLFVQPLYTLTISDPGEWLNLVVLLFVAIVVGQLAAIMRARADVAEAREREARSLFQVSRVLATRPSTAAVLPALADTLAREATMSRVWMALGPDDARERVAADTGKGPRPPSTIHVVLRRMPGDTPAQWLRVHDPSRRSGTRDVAGLPHRVRIEGGGATFGSIWALRPRDAGEPDRTETRLLAAAADQIGQALAQDRLAAEAQAAEIARQSDELKSALLQSVSHDLRTPLATIRAAAGTLRDPDVVLSRTDQLESAEAIEREVEYLNRLVTNLLDLSRIEAGALRAERDVFELEDLVARTLDRLRSRLADRPVEVGVDSPPVEVDPVFLDEALTNVLDNAVKYTPAGTRLRVRSSELPGEPFVRLTVEDAGPGAPDDALPRLFDKFYRVPGADRGSRSGTGVGLAVVRGLVEAMGGRVAARRSELGGLAVDLDLPVAAIPAAIALGEAG